MKAILVANREPYLHYRSVPDGGAGRSAQHGGPRSSSSHDGRGGSGIQSPSPRIFVPEPVITIEVMPILVFDSEADLYVIPAEIFTGLSSKERPHPSFAYGPVAMMEAAFDAGCMDYLREPWIIPELEARSIRYETIRFRILDRDITVNSRRMSCGEESPVALRHGEYVALRLLVMARCQCIPRESLEYAIWGTARPRSRSLDVLISSLRASLEHLVPGAGDCLSSARGFGYRLETRSCG